MQGGSPSSASSRSRRSRSRSLSSSRKTSRASTPGGAAHPAPEPPVLDDPHQFPPLQSTSPLPPALSADSACGFPVSGTPPAAHLSPAAPAVGPFGAQPAAPSRFFDPEALPEPYVDMLRRSVRADTCDMTTETILRGSKVAMRPPSAQATGSPSTGRSTATATPGASPGVKSRPSADSPTPDPDRSGSQTTSADRSSAPPQRLTMEAMRHMKKVLSTMSLSPPGSTTTNAPGLFPVTHGLCRHTRRELDEDRVARVTEGGDMGPSPYHMVHFENRWMCTSCRKPIMHHFDCSRTMEELDRERQRRIRVANARAHAGSRLGSAFPSDDDDVIGGSITIQTPNMGFSVGSSPPALVLGPSATVAPARHSQPCAADPGVGSSEAGSLGMAIPPPRRVRSLNVSREQPRSSGDGLSVPQRGSTSPDLEAFKRDPRYLVHYDDGRWVCSLKNCGQPIEFHRSVPVSQDTNFKLYQPPDGSHLNVLARFVGRVGAVSPRLATKETAARSNSSTDMGAPSPSGGASYATTNTAHLARVKMGPVAEVCAVCGYPDRRPYHGYPTSKTNKHGETHGPPVTMAHILAPDALDQVCYEDDATNYIPLCGTLGWEGSCHDAFDKNLLLFAYEGRRANDGRFMAWASDERYRHLSGRHVVFLNKPHRSALHARARHALTSAQVVETPEMVSEAIIKMWNAEPPDDDEEDTPSPNSILPSPPAMPSVDT